MSPLVVRHGNLIKDLYRFRALRWRQVIVGIALALVLWLIQLNAILVSSAQEFAVAGSFAIVGNLEPRWTCTNYINVAVGIGIMAIMVPPIEETINRGFVLHYFLPRGQLFSVVLSSIIFSAFHKPEVMYMTFIAGIYFAYLTLNTSSLWTATIAHSAHNFFAQFDASCLFIAWKTMPTEMGVARIAMASILATILLLGIAAILVSSKIARAP
jgi:membrane protease YdiL (CAAX protease family)